MSQELFKILERARHDGRAIFHFNFAELTVLKAIVAVARRLKAPVIVGMSEGERNFFDAKWAAKLISEIRESHPGIFLNADHTHSFEGVKEAVAAGFDAILFDGGRLPLMKNIKETRRAVEYIKSKNPKILVEGELGYIGSSSQLHKKIPKGIAISSEQLTTVEEARKFVEETGVDLLAPAVGSVHGIIEGFKPKLDYKRIKEIAVIVSTPLVLHGASGLSDSSIKKAIKAGVSIVHINTEIRLAWRKALEQSLKQRKNELAPYKILDKPMAAAEKIVEKKMKLC